MAAVLLWLHNTLHHVTYSAEPDTDNCFKPQHTCAQSTADRMQNISTANLSNHNEKVHLQQAQTLEWSHHGHHTRHDWSSNRTTS